MAANRSTCSNPQLFGGGADDFGDKLCAAGFEDDAFAAVRIKKFGDSAFEEVAGADGFGGIMIF